MAYVIGGGCIMCGSCAGECPVGAIAEGDGKYEINADACVDCGTCAGSCPVGAISQGEFLNTYKAKYKTLFRLEWGFYFCLKQQSGRAFLAPNGWGTRTA